MEQILQLVSRSQLFSLLDEFFGYIQVVMAEPDRLKTTFQTKWETYAYRRMHFVLMKTIATFQREMEIAFKGLIYQSMVVYLDEGNIYYEKREDH